mmetsp:Transcript_11271/g.20422  ORF Transcript_11271/g.20422 Transcript_11271/m.20422 type:complete len:262 (+) Transcript_11271:1545-2330(+)
MDTLLLLGVAGAKSSELIPTPGHYLAIVVGRETVPSPAADADDPGVVPAPEPKTLYYFGFDALALSPKLAEVVIAPRVNITVVSKAEGELSTTADLPNLGRNNILHVGRDTDVALVIHAVAQFFGVVLPRCCGNLRPAHGHAGTPTVERSVVSNGDGVVRSTLNLCRDPLEVLDAAREGGVLEIAVSELSLPPGSPRENLSSVGEGQSVVLSARDHLDAQLVRDGAVDNDVVNLIRLEHQSLKRSVLALLLVGAVAELPAI